MRTSILLMLQNVFKVRPEEAPRTALAFLYLFSAVGAFIISRITRTVLFLEIPGYREKLPLMYILQAVVVSLTMYGYARVERRLRRDRTNGISLALIIGINLIFRFVVEQGGEAAAMAFYVWVEIFGTLLIVQFWSIANEIFHSRQAKRVFALIGGGGVLANVFIGFGIKGSVKHLGTENLIYVICAALAMSLVMVWLLGRDARTELNLARERSSSGKRGKAPGTRSQPQKVFSTRHVQLIAAVIVVTYLVSTLVDYQFQVIVGDSIRLKDDRSAYFGLFFGVTGILAGGIQFFCTSRLLERFGVLFALLLLPGAMMAGSAGLLMMPGLWAAAFTKGSENTLRYSINDTTLQLLYLPVPAHIRGRAKAVIDGILKPVSIGGAGVLLAILTGSAARYLGVDLGISVDVHSLSWVVMGALMLWIVSLIALRREYLSSLLRTLQRRRLNFADARFQITDEATIKSLDLALASSRMGEVLHALELLPFVSSKGRQHLDAKVAQLLDHEFQQVRVAALKYWANTEGTLHSERVGELLEDPSAPVRAAATEAFCAIRRGEALGKVQPLLEDPDLYVRAAAVAGLIRYGGLDGVLACADLLKRMLSSSTPQERERAAWILGEVGVQNFYQPLMPLFEDEAEKVRLAAIEATARIRPPELISSLLPQLNHSRLAGAAVAALAAYGSEIRPVAAGILADQGKPSAMRVACCKVLARLGDGDSVEILTGFLEDSDALVRSAVVTALGSVISYSPNVRLDRESVRRAIRSECKSYFALLALEQDLKMGSDATLLRDALATRKEQTLNRVLGLLTLRYPARTVELVSRNLESSVATTQANAVEVLDNLLDKDEKAWIIPIVDDATPTRKLAVGRDLFGLESSGRPDRLGELLRSKDAWIRACGAMAVAEWREGSLRQEVRDLLGSDDPICRETGIVVLRRLEDDKELAERLPSLGKDPASSVRKYARFVLSEMS